MEENYKTIKWEREKEFGTITISRPPYNALIPEMRAELMDVLREVKELEEIRAIILTGENSMFCVGGDLKSFSERARNRRLRGGVSEMMTNDVARAFLATEIPIIAAINGPAVGGGLTLSLTCDFRIACEEAKFIAGFTRVGLAPEYGSSFLLARIVGLTWASEMIFTGRVINAHKALSIGLISEVVPRQHLLDKAQSIARKVASFSPFAVRMSKKVLRQGLECTLSQALDYETLALTHCFNTLDHEESVNAFLEKRLPMLRGY